MAHHSQLIEKDILAYLKSQEEKSLLRFITCGSVDDGKSTLIGRLLWDSKLIFEDQLAALEADSKRVGTQGERIDYALLLDGLQAEREQGITIDVAYRFFSTDKRKFIVADTPGHEQYTRNMVTGASTAQVAVILIDARKGILTQTRRHSYLVSLVGIRHIVLAINKMDLVGYDAARFEAIRADYADFAATLGFEQIAAIPISALEGDNILARSANTPWYAGPTLMEHLETVQVAVTAAKQPLRLPVQWVNRPHLDFRGFAGTLAAGTLRPGDPVQVASSGRTSRVARIVTFDGDLPAAIAGQAVTVTLEDEIDISRGDLLVAPQAPPTTSARWEATLVWLYEQPLTLGRSYLLKSGAATVPVQVEQVRELVDVNTLEPLPGAPLTLNAIGRVALRLDRPLPLDPYRESRGSGSFILIDRFSNATVAAGLVEAPLAAVADNKRPTVVDRIARATLKGQAPQLLWFSGRDPAAATAVARAVESRMHRRGLHTTLLAAPQLEPDLAGKLPALAHLLLDAGLIVLVVGSEAQAAEAAQLSGDALHLITLDTELAPATILEQTLQRLEPLLVTNDFVTPGIIC